LDEDSTASSFFFEVAIRTPDPYKMYIRLGTVRSSLGVQIELIFLSGDACVDIDPDESNKPYKQVQILKINAVLTYT